MSILALDTATGATAVGLLRDDDVVFEARHDPGPGERPGHATRLLGLVAEVCGAAEVPLAEVGRIAAGTGPGSFTGLRIGVATARALAQGSGAALVGVGTLRTLAAGAAGPETVLAIVDARRGEVFAAAWTGERARLAPTALAPAALASRVRQLGTPLAIGDGALRFRDDWELAGARVPPDGDPLHRISARHACRLAAGAQAAGPGGVLPDYLRRPDAEIRRGRRTPTDR
jgi:tRNA threonylcarbamoyladenosine biosynthesis protein TsaB